MLGADGVHKEKIARIVHGGDGRLGAFYQRAIFGLALAERRCDAVLLGDIARVGHHAAHGGDVQLIAAGRLEPAPRTVFVTKAEIEGERLARLLYHIA